MKRILLACLMFLGVSAADAAGNDWRYFRRDPTNVTNLVFDIPTPANSSLLMIDITSGVATPKHIALGSGLSYDGTTLSSSLPSIAISDVTGLQTALDSKFATPAGTTSQYVRGDGSLATFPSVGSRSFSYPTRALNTCFQPSATRDAMTTYTVDVGTTLSLTGGTTGTVYLEIFTDSACTAGTQEITRFVNSNTGALTIGLNISQTVTGSLSGVIPAGAYVKLRTQNNTGTPTFTARPGQETLF